MSTLNHSSDLYDAFLSGYEGDGQMAVSGRQGIETSTNTTPQIEPSSILTALTGIAPRVFAPGSTIRFGPLATDRLLAANLSQTIWADLSVTPDDANEVISIAKIFLDELDKTPNLRPMKDNLIDPKFRSGTKIDDTVLCTFMVWERILRHAQAVHQSKAYGEIDPLRGMMMLTEESATSVFVNDVVDEGSKRRKVPTKKSMFARGKNAVFDLIEEWRQNTSAMERSMLSKVNRTAGQASLSRSQPFPTTWEPQSPSLLAGQTSLPGALAPTADMGPSTSVWMDTTLAAHLAKYVPALSSESFCRRKNPSVEPLEGSILDTPMSADSYTVQALQDILSEGGGHFSASRDEPKTSSHYVGTIVRISDLLTALDDDMSDTEMRSTYQLLEAAAGFLQAVELKVNNPDYADAIDLIDHLGSLPDVQAHALESPSFLKNETMVEEITEYWHRSTRAVHLLPSGKSSQINWSKYLPAMSEHLREQVILANQSHLQE